MRCTPASGVIERAFGVPKTGTFVMQDVSRSSHQSSIPG